MQLIPGALSLTSLKKMGKEKTAFQLDETCRPKVQAALETKRQLLNEKKIIYGVNTGFGQLAHHIISPLKTEMLQQNLVLSHACGSGPLLQDEVVALILILKINALSQGYSGVRMELIDALSQLYHHEVYPCVPSKGSVGASGDLVPLAHLSLPLLGVGDVRYQGQRISAKKGLKIASLKPLTLEAKEGLALLNGLQVSTALCCHAFFKTEVLFETAILAGCLSLEAARGSRIPFDDRIHLIRGHQAQREVAAKYRDLLAESLIEPSSRIQDPYSLRCQPQVMGAILHQMRMIQETLEVEINGVTDNPLVFSETSDILSGGNFHGEMVAMLSDILALVIAEMGAIAERRIALLIDKNFSGLPPFLVKDSGLNSGFMMPQVTAAACASANKALAHPHVVDNIPTSANQEDHVSMATNAALRLEEMVDNTATILAIELLAATQGLDFLLPLKTSPKLQKLVSVIRQKVKPYEKDRYFAPDIELIKQEILTGALLR